MVSIFAGDFPSQAAADEYFREQYDDDVEEDFDVDSEDESKPLSRFAADFSIGWYDHDSFERDHRASGDRSLRSMFGPASYSSSFLEAVVERGDELGRTEANTIALLYDFAFDVDRRRLSQGTYTRRLAGTFVRRPHA